MSIQKNSATNVNGRSSPSGNVVYDGDGNDNRGVVPGGLDGHGLPGFADESVNGHDFST